MNLAKSSLSRIGAPLSKIERILLCWILNTAHASVAFPEEHAVAFAHRKLRKLREHLREGLLLTLVES